MKLRRVSLPQVLKSEACPSQSSCQVSRHLAVEANQVANLGAADPRVGDEHMREAEDVGHEYKGWFEGGGSLPWRRREPSVWGAYHTVRQTVQTPRYVGRASKRRTLSMCRPQRDNTRAPTFRAKVARDGTDSDRRPSG